MQQSSEFDCIKIGWALSQNMTRVVPTDCRSFEAIEGNRGIFSHRQPSGTSILGHVHNAGLAHVRVFTQDKCYRGWAMTNHFRPTIKLHKCDKRGSKTVPKTLLPNARWKVRSSVRLPNNSCGLNTHSSTPSNQRNP